jgi:hypothetical protein
MLFTLVTPTHAFTMETSTRLSSVVDQVLEVSGSSEVRRLNFKFYDNSETFYEYNLAFVSGLVSYFNVDFIYVLQKPINIEVYTANVSNSITHYNISIIRFTTNSYALYDNNGTLINAMEWIDVPALTNFRYTYNLTWSTEYQNGVTAGYLNGRNEFGYYDSVSGTWKNYQNGYDLGYITGLEEATTDAYNTGVNVGRNQVVTNGSVEYGFDIQTSYDYIAGVYVGRQENVNAGMTNFMTDFDKWIVPAILIVLILGGFIAVVNRKRNE